MIKFAIVTFNNTGQNDLCNVGLDKPLKSFNVVNVEVMLFIYSSKRI